MTSQWISIFLPIVSKNILSLASYGCSWTIHFQNQLQFPKPSSDFLSTSKCPSSTEEMEKFQAKVAMLDATIRAVMSHGEHVFLDTRQYRMRHPDFRAQTMKHSADFENMPWTKDSKNTIKNRIIEHL